MAGTRLKGLSGLGGLHMRLGYSQRSGADFVHFGFRIPTFRFEGEILDGGVCLCTLGSFFTFVLVVFEIDEIEVSR